MKAKELIAMDVTGIAAASISMSQAQLANNVSLSLMKKTMDTVEAQAAELLEMLPPSDHLIDVLA